MITIKEAVEAAKKEYKGWKIDRCLDFETHYVFDMTPPNFNNYMIGEQFGVNKTTGKVEDFSLIVEGINNPKRYDRCIKRTVQIDEES